MYKLLAAVLLFIVLSLPEKAFAVVIAQQNQRWEDSFLVWRAIQELGDNLSGTADKFTFRVSTSVSNLGQFDYTGTNSRIYDKFNNSFITGCTLPGSNPADRIGDLTFSTAGVPVGFEDVTIDFSCRNYTFIPGHRYLIFISNANMANPGWGIFFGAAKSGSMGDLFTGGGLRSGGSCDPAKYRWGSTNPIYLGEHSHCWVWSTPQDDLYFVLTNTALPPKTPVVFIPGIGGSEFKAAQEIFWTDQDDGHGGKFSHAYKPDEKIWVNQDEAVSLGDDDYFDVLRLKPDGQTSEAALSLTGELTSFGYGDIDPFFTGMGYVKGTNFFVFPYDWRKDVRTTQTDLDNLIETAKQKTGLSKVNIVAHSMGGLVAHNYIADASKASKVNKLIELGVPHLGAPGSLKTLMYGIQLGPSYLFGLISLNKNEVRDIAQNLTSNSQLNPSKSYFNFYDNSSPEQLYPFKDDRDIDNDSITGALNFDQTKSLLTKLNYNMTVIGMGEEFHNLIDSTLNQSNGVKLYEIVGSAQPTLGQIRETYWITWPANLIPKTDEVFINGDDTVPLYSASLKKDGLDLSGGAKIYYVEQKHSDLVSKNGSAMQTVRKILEEDNSIPVEVKSDKYTLDGKHISADGDIDLDLYDDAGNHTGLNDKGEIEENIPHTFYTTSKKTKHAFVKKNSPKVTVKVKSTPKKSSSTIRIRHYQSDSITKTTTYKDVPVNDTAPITFPVDPSTDNSPTILADNNIPAVDVAGDNALDQTTPKTSIQISGNKDSSGIYNGAVTITLTGEDSGSGILKIEYSLDNGQTIQNYTEPFTISTLGKTTILVKAVDKLGNEEIPQEVTIEIAAPPSPTPTPTSHSTSANNGSSPNSNSSGNSADNTSSTNTIVNSNSVIPAQAGIHTNNSATQGVLGLSFKNPNHIADQLNINPIFGKEKEPISDKKGVNQMRINLSGLLIFTGRMIALASLGLLLTFIKPTPK